MKRAMTSVPLALLVPLTLALGCDRSPTDGAGAGSDDIAFAKGGNGGGGNGGGGFTPIPVTIEASGGFIVQPQAAFIKNETADLIEFGSMGLVVTRTANFLQTAAAARANGFADCASKVGSKGGELPLSEKQRLISWIEGVERSGDFNGSIGLANLGASGPNEVGSRTTDSDPNQHVGLDTYSLIEGAEGPTVTRAGDVFTFTGGVVQMWDRNVPVPQHATLQCPNLDEVVLTITR